MMQWQLLFSKVSHCSSSYFTALKKTKGFTLLCTDVLNIVNYYHL